MNQKDMPNILLEEQETFEFGCSQSLECSPNSPADHLFLNGKLQPHVFPAPNPQINPNPISPSSSSTSRNGSIRSGMEYYNDFLLSSSRSNSSSSSGGGSARTSISESSSRKVASIDGSGGRKRRKSTSSMSKEECSFWKQYYHHQHDKKTLAPDFGSSLRWQFITPVPDFKSQSARRSTRVHNVQLETLRVRSRKGNGSEAGAWFGLKMLRLLATACLSCHSIRPPNAEQ